MLKAVESIVENLAHLLDRIEPRTPQFKTSSLTTEPTSRLSDAAVGEKLWWTIFYSNLLCVEHKTPTIKNRNNHVPYVIRNISLKSYKNTRKHNTQKCQEVSNFPAVDHKSTKKNQASITRSNWNINNKIINKSNALEQSAKLTGGLKPV